MLWETMAKHHSVVPQKKLQWVHRVLPRQQHEHRQQMFNQNSTIQPHVRRWKRTLSHQALRMWRFDQLTKQRRGVGVCQEILHDQHQHRQDE